MIETAEGREKAEEIITTPGLDAVYIGPADSALSMGLPAMGDQPQEGALGGSEKIISTLKNIKLQEFTRAGSNIHKNISSLVLTLLRWEVTQAI